jgi:hypothetical protein
MFPIYGIGQDVTHFLEVSSAKNVSEQIKEQD